MRDFRYVASTMLDGPFDPRRMITSVVPLDRLPEIFSQLLSANGETKVHIAPHLE
jgi:threonine dehydrogenase-like Zn-dependent dehydrogenase